MLRMAGIEHKLKQTMEIITRIEMKIIVCFLWFSLFYFFVANGKYRKLLNTIMEIIHRLGIKIP